MTVIGQVISLPAEYWENFTVESTDIEFMYNDLMENHFNEMLVYYPLDWYNIVPNNSSNPILSKDVRKIVILNVAKGEVKNPGKHILT